MFIVGEEIMDDVQNDYNDILVKSDNENVM